MNTPSDLATRIDRLESLDAIRQLAAKYSLALDMRDSDAWVGLFPEDVRVGDGKTGRKALREWFEETMRQQFDGTAHHVGNHIIEFEDPDHAQGILYSKNEHETGAEWVIMQMMYFDKYERIAGGWFFRRRLPLYWYATDLNKPPVGNRKMRWPGHPPYEGSFHDLFPSWNEFWARNQPSDQPVAPPAPIDKFIETMRRGHPLPKPRVRS
jgi:hypothetical protein